MRPISKIALYSGIVLLLIGVILFWLGGLKKDYQVDTLIDAPADAVFPHLTDPELIPNWMHSVVSIEPITSEGHQEGARAKIIYEYEGKRIEFRDEVIVTDQNSRLLVTADCPMFRNSSDYILNPREKLTLPGKTNLRLTFQVQYKGFYRFLGPFSGGSVQPKLEEDMQRLKLEVERVYRDASIRNGTMKKAHAEDSLNGQQTDTNKSGGNKTNKTGADPAGVNKAKGGGNDKGNDGALNKKLNNQASSKQGEQKK